MAFDAFVRIDNIRGESTDSDYSEWIEVIDYGLAHRQKVSSTASSVGGTSAERVYFRELVFKKLVDISSPQLSMACADGPHIDEISLVLCRAGTRKVKYMEYQLNNCIVWQMITSGYGRFPTDTVRINFGKIKWTYSQQSRDNGAPIGNIATGWNLENNCRMWLFVSH